MLSGIRRDPALNGTVGDDSASIADQRVPGSEALVADAGGLPLGQRIFTDAWLVTEPWSAGRHRVPPGTIARELGGEGSGTETM